MNSKEIVFSAMELGKPSRVPVAPFGCGVWTIHRSCTTFMELSQDPGRMAQTNMDIYRKFKADIVYAGSGYNNLHTLNDYAWSCLCPVIRRDTSLNHKSPSPKRRERGSGVL